MPWTLDAMTATLVEQKDEPTDIGVALCCGSARKLPGGHWLMSWGSTGMISELSSSGSKVFSLTFDDGLFSYRAHPCRLAPSVAPPLRAGMDAQYPRSYARPRSAGIALLNYPLVPRLPRVRGAGSGARAAAGVHSCSSPTGASSQLTIGTDDANGAETNSSGFVSYGVITRNPATPANEADVSLRVDLSDVR